MADLNPSLMFSRNAPFINDQLQARLAELRVGLVGCGLASQIAEALTRLGVRQLTVWDFDTVEISNLNRQAFTREDLGHNKAEACATWLRRIRPDMKIQVKPRRFAATDLTRSLPQLDVVINSADFEDPLLYAIGDTMQAQGGWCIQPLNLGFGGCCLLLGPDSPALARLTGGEQRQTATFIHNLLDNCQGFEPSPQLQANGPQLLAAGETAGWFPQNIVATLFSTALVSWSLVQIAAGTAQQIAAPRLLHFEPKL